MSLSQKQAGFKETFKRLLTPWPIREGKTFAMACAFIELAIEHPEFKVYYFDHHDPTCSQTRELMRLKISELIGTKYKIPDGFRMEISPKYVVMKRG